MTVAEAPPYRPPAAAAVEDAASLVRAVFDRAAAAMVDPPILQPADLYVELSGEDVRARLFFVSDPQGRSLVLRPDLTLPVCRRHIEEHGAAPGRYRYEGKAFRFAAPHTGRPSEFLQIGLEVIGPDDVAAAEAEVFALSMEAVRAVGAHAGEVILGDGGLFAAFVDAVGLAPEAAARIKRRYADAAAFEAQAEPSSPLAAALAAVDPDVARAAIDEIYALTGFAAVGERPLEAVAGRLLAKAAAERADAGSPAALALAERMARVDDSPRQALEAVAAIAKEAGANLDARLNGWARRLDAYDAAGLDAAVARLSVRFARQFDYYNGAVFEIRDPALGQANVLAAGGRYDALLARLSGENGVAGVGCAVRPGRLAASRTAAGG